MIEKLKCPVCGRKFPKGQGVTLSFGGETLTFHSKSCAIKFVRHLLDKIDRSSITSAFKETRREFEELLKKREESIAKKI